MPPALQQVNLHGACSMAKATEPPPATHSSPGETDRTHSALYSVRQQALVPPSAPSPLPCSSSCSRECTHTHPPLSRPGPSELGIASRRALRQMLNPAKAWLSPATPLSTPGPPAAPTSGCCTTPGTCHDLGIYPHITCTLSCGYGAQLSPRDRAGCREHTPQSSHRCCQVLSH